MFKNLVLYTVGGELPPTASLLEDELARRAFVSCGPTQGASFGWVPPRESHGALVEAVAGQWLMKHQTEAKLLPKEVIQRRVAEMAAQIEQQTGRKPGKRQRRELADQAELDLLPAAFSRLSTTLAWLDYDNKLLLIGASSQNKADLVMGELSRAWPTMNLHQLRVKRYVDASMAAWMLDGAPGQFTVDRDAVLESTEQDHAIVRYQQINLDAPDVHDHLRGGKVPTKLALTFEARVSFVLVDDLRIQKIQIADVAFMEKTDAADEGFDADVAISTGELRKLVSALIAELGGIAPLPIEEAAAAGGGDAELAACVAKLRKAGATEMIKPLRGDVPITYGTDEDPMFTAARDIVVAQGKASISQIQRHLRIGYNRAARLLEAMESAGFVSPMDPRGNRTVRAGA